MAAGAFHLALGPVNRQRHRAGGARGNAHHRVARAVGVGWVAQAIVDHRGGGAIGLVDRHGHVRCRHFDVVAQTHEGHRGRIGLQGGPFAGGGIAALRELLGHQGQAEVHPRHRQAQLVGCAAVDAGKGAQVAAAHAQQVHVDRFACVLSGLLGQLHSSRAALDRQVTFDLEEAVHVQHQVAAGAFHLALGPVQGQGQIVGRSGGHCQHSFSCAVRVGRIGQAVVHHMGGRAVGLVDGHRHASGRDRQIAAHAHKTHRTCGGLQRGPTAHHSARGFQAGAVFGQQSQAEFDLGQAQTGSGRGQMPLAVKAAVHAGKRIQVGAADQQGIDLHGIAVVQGDALGFGDDAKVAHGGHKAQDIECQMTPDFGEFAHGAV